MRPMAGLNTKLFQAGLINEYKLEYRARCRASPIQPEVEKEIQPEVEASSSKLQASSATKRTQLNSTKNYTE